MQNTIWIELFRIIPQHLHASLAIVSITGQELIAQQFYRFDSEVFVMRARLSGSMEGSRIIILPYAHIDYLAFTKVLPEPEIQEIFGAMGGSALAAFQAPAPAPTQAASAPAAPMPTSTPMVPAALPTQGPGMASMTQGPGAAMQTASLASRIPKAAPTPEAAEEGETTKPGQMSKTLLLARLRERLSQKK